VLLYPVLCNALAETEKEVKKKLKQRQNCHLPAGHKAYITPRAVPLEIQWEISTTDVGAQHVWQKHSPDIAKEFTRKRLKSIKSHSRILANKGGWLEEGAMCRQIETFINHAKNCWQITITAANTTPVEHYWKYSCVCYFWAVLCNTKYKGDLIHFLEEVPILGNDGVINF